MKCNPCDGTGYVTEQDTDGRTVVNERVQCSTCKGSGETPGGVTIVADDQWVCVDCIMFIANGDLPEDEAEAARIKAVFDDMGNPKHYWVPQGPRPARGVEPPTEEELINAIDWWRELTMEPGSRAWNEERAALLEKVHALCNPDEYEPAEEEGVDTQEFSWRACDCCCSPLGGSRHRAAVLGPAT